MKFGYVRESMDENDMDFQIDALESYGVDEIYIEYSYNKNPKNTKLPTILQLFTKFLQRGILKYKNYWKKFRTCFDQF